MPETVLQLYPLPSQSHALKGLYLSHHLRDLAHQQKQPFVYSNFISSLDARIGLGATTTQSFSVPPQITNPRDWRLFQELAVQADIIITSGSYMRGYEAGRVQDILQVYDDPHLADLQTWRLARDLPSHPDLAILSRSLNFAIPETLMASGRTVIIFTVNQVDREAVQRLEDQGGTVIFAGDHHVAGQQVIQALAQRGYRLIYSAAGSTTLHTLLTAKVLDRLYLTQAHCLLGGTSYVSIVAGDQFEPAIAMRLNTLYLDSVDTDRLGQTLISYDCISH